jgi:hypothetical protein
MFLSIAFVTPIKSLSFRIAADLFKGYLWVQKGLSFVLDPKLINFDDKERLSEATTSTGEEELPEYIDSTMFTISTVSYMSILLTFSITFPLLSVMACVAIVSETYYNQILVGRVMQNLENLGKSDAALMSHLSALETQCNGVSEYIGSSIEILFPLSLTFLSFFIFDLYDYVASTGYTTKIIPVLMITSPVFIQLFRYVYNRRENTRSPSINDGSCVEVSNVLQID